MNQIYLHQWSQQLLNLRRWQPISLPWVPLGVQNVPRWRPCDARESHKSRPSGNSWQALNLNKYVTTRPRSRNYTVFTTLYLFYDDLLIQIYRVVSLWAFRWLRVFLSKKSLSSPSSVTFFSRGLFHATPFVYLYPIFLQSDSPVIIYFSLVNLSITSAQHQSKTVERNFALIPHFPLHPTRAHTTLHLFQLSLPLTLSLSYILSTPFSLTHSPTLSLYIYI